MEAVIFIYLAGAAITLCVNLAEDFPLLIGRTLAWPILALRYVAAVGTTTFES